jgi:hypothetical protein
VPFVGPGDRVRDSAGRGEATSRMASAAASGNTGMRMCIAKVPVAVNGARRRFDSSGVVSQSNQPAASTLRLRLSTAAGAEPLRECSSHCKA